jgi:hypothetical protein
MPILAAILSFVLGLCLGIEFLIWIIMRSNELPSSERDPVLKFFKGMKVKKNG